MVLFVAVCFETELYEVAQVSAEVVVEGGEHSRQQAIVALSDRVKIEKFLMYKKFQKINERSFSAHPGYIQPSLALQHLLIDCH